jgi:hypothetical protein
MTADRAPDDVSTAEAAHILGLPLRRLRVLMQSGQVKPTGWGRVGLIAVACAHIAAMRADAERLPTSAERRAAAKRDDAGRRAILDLEAEALRDLKRLARGAPPERAAAISAAAGRIKAARVEALRILHDA